MKLVFVRGSGCMGEMWQHQTDYFVDADAPEPAGPSRGTGLAGHQQTRGVASQMICIRTRTQPPTRADHRLDNERILGRYRMPIKVYDFFAGCGGSSLGFKLAGLTPVFALDNDPDAMSTFQANISGVHYELKDIRHFSTQALEPFMKLAEGHARLFCGCAPCQPFTKQLTKPRDADKKRTLLGEFSRFVEHFHPELVFVENVPGMQNVQGKEGPFDDFLAMLEAQKYHSTHGIVMSQSYGVPQIRRRLVLIASRLGLISLPAKTHGPKAPAPQYSCVRDWIWDLPKIGAGQTDAEDPCHRAAALSATNLKRIRALQEGQDRRVWANELTLACHGGEYHGHTDVYGRMSWDKRASGLTTRCISLSNGRFGHPEQDRAISVREAALLQTFPRNVQFTGSIASMARQIGNAVPVLLAQRFGEHFVAHVREHMTEGSR